MNYVRQKNIDIFVLLIGGFFFIVLALLFMFGWPHYKVWKQGMDGQAALAEAEQSKMIQVQVAKAELESAKLRAEAIKLVGQAAKDYPEYRKQEFIGAFGEALRDGKIQQIIYVPTEANIPIVEAGNKPASNQ
jgi:regulator of protease activity HflC (stomatin/prohibitin superfamily)